MSSSLEHFVEDVERRADGPVGVFDPPKVDFTHHLSTLAKSRTPSPLKVLFKYFNDPDMLMLAGGLPAPEYFPFDSISAEALVPNSFTSSRSIPPSGIPSSSSSGPLSWLWKLFGAAAPIETKTLSVPKFTASPADLQLSSALQYSLASGIPQLQQFLNSFSKEVFRPLNPKTTTFVHIGNTDGWAKAVATLCNRGEMILTEDWTYPSAIGAAWPLGVTPVGVGMDAEGMRADLLEETLASWDEVARGAPRPHVMYTVPVGQNPCGTTMGAERKKAIYDICVKYDVIIVEDDPYYFLQVGDYKPPAQRTESISSGDEADDRRFLDSLVPSYLRFDYQGRVIRMDTFSKTIAPGSRMGWFTCNPLFAERLERHAETTTAAPSGFSQALITQLLANHWQYHGFIQWLKGIRSQYTLRRNAMLDAIAEVFDVEEDWAPDGEFAPFTGPTRVYIARAKSSGLLPSFREKKRKVLFSYVAPTAGMFVWLKVHLYNDAGFDPDAPPPKSLEESLEFQFFEALAQNKVLFGPGWIFGTDDDSALTGNAGDLLVDVNEMHAKKPRTLSNRGRYGHLRISYSNPSPDDLKEAMLRLSQVFQKRFN